MTLEEKIEYIGKDKFVKFTNTEAFPKLSEKLRTFLKETGIYSDRKGYPYLMINGELKQISDNLIQIGEGIVGDPFCIDVSDREQIVLYNKKDNGTSIVNTSLEKYIECLYTTYYFSDEYEGKEKLGVYYKNHKKYAKELQKMLEKIEPKAMELPIWGGMIYEMDLGVI